MAAEEKGDKPRVIVLGGCGFIGRNFVKYLVDNDVCSFIRVADKAMPMTSYFSDEIKEAFSNAAVSTKQVDLTRDVHVEKAFSDGPYDYVVNLCGETRCGLPEADYQRKILHPAEKCGAAAKRMGITKWVEVSTGMAYQSKKHLSKEDSPLAPWTVQSRFRVQVEQNLKTMGIPYVILRPTLVYGPADLTSITPKMCCASVYQSRRKKMKMLWNAKLMINCVHVRDVVRALWVSCTELESGSIYNLSDKSNLDQGKLNAMLGRMFGIKTGFLGSVISNLAKVNLSGFAAAANDEHVPGWQKLCQSHKIMNTPISPYIDKELLYNHHLAVDGSLIERDSNSFEYQHPKLTEELLREVLMEFIHQQIFPPVL